jgi:hypothetical protein
MMKQKKEYSASGVTAKFHPLPVIGWREYAKFPDLNIERIKAKVDTGARSSSLHAVNIEYFTKQGERWVRFEVHPDQKTSKVVVSCQAKLLDERQVKDSGGKRTHRPVIETTIVLGVTPIKAELTLIARDAMGFRMLIGRQAVRGRFLVDPGHSYKMGRPKKKKKKKKAKKKV